MPQAILRWIAWFLLAAIAYFTLSPIEQRPVTDAPVDFERLAIFVALGVVFAQSYSLRLIRTFLLLIICIGLLEAAQDFVPGRHGRVQDAAVKASGMLLGFALAAIAFRIRKAS
jgi:VanZ family protein